ncbi:hypothetical protein D3C73_759980 [compost metagenome]
MAVIGRAGGPAGQGNLRADAQFAFVDVDVAVAPAPQQAELDAAVVAVEAHVHLRAVFLVVHLLGRKHDAIERVVRVVQPLRIVEAVAGQAAALVQRAVEGLAVELEARLHFIVHPLFGTGEAELVIYHRVGQLVLATQAGREGVLFLGAVAHALVDGILRHAIQTVLVGSGLDHFRVIEIEDHTLAGFGIIELAVQRTQVVLAVIVRAPVQVEVGADALALDLILAVLQVDRGDVARRGIVFAVVLHFGVVRFELALLVVHAQRHAEGVIEHFAVVESGLRAGFAGQLLVAGFDLAAQAAAVTIEGRGRFNQDRAADGVARHVRGRRLDHAQALGRIRRNHIQRRRTAGIFRGADGDAVDADAVEVGIQATHHHETAFALVAGHADARQALQRLGHVLVRVLAQRVGRHGVFNGITAALEVNRAYLRFQLRTYFDAVQIGRRGAAAGRCSGFGCQHRRAGRHQQ